MPLSPDPPGELGECLRIERRIEAAFDQALEPVPSGFYEDNEPAPQR